MKEAIEYFYNYSNLKIRAVNSIYRFVWNNNEFALVPYERSLKDINDLVKRNFELRKLGFNSHVLIVNRFGNIISFINNCNYVLLQLMGNLNEEIDIFMIVETCKKYKVNMQNPDYKFINWSILWQKKIDYLENQIKLLGEEKERILSNFSYYIGLAENAIIYYNSINKKYKPQISLTHRRIFYPNIWLNYGNPLSFVYDIPCRDYAEYIKSTFFYDSISAGYESLDFLLKTERMDKQSLEMLIARLLFPSYYFDVFENAIFNECNEENLLKIIEKSKDFEKFLKFCYWKIKAMVEINTIPSWLL